MILPYHALLQVLVQRQQFVTLFGLDFTEWNTRPVSDHSRHFGRFNLVANLLTKHFEFSQHPGQMIG